MQEGTSRSALFVIKKTMPLYIGVDAGGTKTLCAVSDGESVVGRARTGTAKIQRVSRAEASRNLINAIQGALAKNQGEEIAAICVGIAGASQPEVIEFVEHNLRPLGAKRSIIVGDHIIAHEAAFKGKAGILVISGTGSIAYGRDDKSQTVRAGGWGPVISDEGSGMWIGREAVRSVLHAEDSGEESLLRDLVFAHWKLARFSDLIALGNATPGPDFPELLPLVLRAARGGDMRAAVLLQRAGVELAHLAFFVQSRLKAGPLVVCGVGGVLENSPEVRESFAIELDSRGLRFEDSIAEPVMGAVYVAQHAPKDELVASLR